MIKIIRTNSENGDFRELVKLLSAELSIADGEDHSVLSDSDDNFATRLTMFCHFKCIC